MQYDRFDDLITRKYGVVVKNWPLKRFCNPSAVATRIELEILFNSWESGATRFEKLSQDELRAWENERFLSQLAMMSAPSPPAAPLPTGRLATPASDLVLFSELPRQDTSQHTSNDVGRGIASTLPLTIQLPVPNPELIAEMVRLDPALGSIDPALIMAGVAQGHYPLTTVTPSTDLDSTLPPVPSAPPTPQGKRNRGAFEIVTPTSFNVPTTKKPRKQQKGRRTKKDTPAAGRENIPSVEGVIH